MQTPKSFFFLRQISTTQCRLKMPYHYRRVKPKEMNWWRKSKRQGNLTAKDAADPRFGGSKEMAMKVGQPIHLRVQSTGYYNKKDHSYRNVKEMIPEFIVPDLTGFELKPYVVYSSKEIKQSKLTAKDLYNQCYARKVAKDIQDGKYDYLDETNSDDKPVKLVDEKS